MVSTNKQLREALQEAKNKLKEEDVKALKAGVSREKLEEIANRNPDLLRRMYNGTANFYDSEFRRDFDKGLNRIYDTAEGLTYRAVDGTFHVAGRLLLPLALLGSVLVGAETYKPGTINRMVKEIPEIAQTLRQVGQQLYQGTSGTQNAPGYIAPSSVPLPPPIPKR